MARLGLTITEEMENVISAEAEKTHIPSSELVRMALKEFFAQRGYTFTESIARGGYREGSGSKPKAGSKRKRQAEE
jgi:hypothetical protein